MSFGRLVGKTAIVTGAGSGIGRAVSRLFAREGASVAVVDVNRDGIFETMSLLMSSHGNKHCTIEADISDAKEANKCIATAEEKLGQRSNILVNNAGIVRDNFLIKITEKQFDDVIAVNLKGTFLMAKEFVTSLRKPEDEIAGSIINMSSIIGKAGNVGQTNYAASKAGVIGMTKTIALEYGRYNIRCNAILPGFIRTPMTAKVPERVVGMMKGMIPMKRMGEAEEIASACLFLASDDSSYVNGACLEVTGGFSA